MNQTARVFSSIFYRRMGLPFGGPEMARKEKDMLAREIKRGVFVLLLMTLAVLPMTATAFADEETAPEEEVISTEESAVEEADEKEAGGSTLSEADENIVADEGEGTASMVIERPERSSEVDPFEAALSQRSLGNGVFSADFRPLRIPASEAEHLLQVLRDAGVIEYGVYCTVENGIITGIDWEPEEEPQEDAEALQEPEIISVPEKTDPLTEAVTRLTEESDYAVQVSGREATPVPSAKNSVAVNDAASSGSGLSQEAAVVASSEQPVNAPEEPPIEEKGAESGLMPFLFGIMTGGTVIGKFLQHVLAAL